MKQRGWERPDFVYVSGDAYVDHPSFGAAIITRVLEAAGFKIAMLSQPDWHSTKDFMRFGKPRLGFLVSSGNIDSMVAHYTAAKKKRSEDAYTPGGKAGCYQEPPQVRVLSFTIGFDEAQTFYKSHGYGIKPSKWHDLTVEVYI